ncbi:TRAP transporter substrate-binding protein [Deinococcus peraridilitoris]|uniref:Extracytoplasmic solute receptor protein n=1 Tax=Deinococcus peraridilitoris (strain DSM 19664 / LMG 22246 / CIP 109416 / KR-200) TaxID=937777 RepID=K9ZZ21_DEIPD|nr:TRAP transporter substrate-binding protein [Deinococcus peraridilitoris]AFZ66152.1 TRAP-type mannitol/chloroaromatic compound transport system, periplasmic component [Deinococcus peraridilitoris DSM 19664]
MNRRKFLKGAGAAVAVSTVFSPYSFAQNRNVRWRLASSFPKSLDTIFGGADVIADRVNKMSGGAFQIRIFEAGELVPGTQVLDAVQAGTVECGHSAGYYYVGKEATLGFATAVPFGLTADQQNAWMYHGGGLDLLRGVYDKFGIVQFPAGNTGTQMGGWFKREVKTAADLKGLKMRIPGIGGQLMARLGVNVQLLPGGEVYLALDRGAIDAAEWVGPYDDEKLGLHKAAKFYYYPGFWEPSATLDLMVNKREYERLPAEFREMLATAAAEANMSMLAEYNAKNQAALQRLVKGGTQLRRFSNDIMNAGRKEMDALHAENAAKNADYRRVYAAFQSFGKNVRAWHNTAQQTYNNYANTK